jgi:hypothetical protein
MIILFIFINNNAFHHFGYLGAFTLGSAAEGLWRVTLSNEDIYKAWAKGEKQIIEKLYCLLLNTAILATE